MLGPTKWMKAAMTRSRELSEACEKQIVAQLGLELNEVIIGFYVVKALYMFVWVFLMGIHGLSCGYMAFT